MGVGGWGREVGGEEVRGGGVELEVKEVGSGG